MLLEGLSIRSAGRLTSTDKNAIIDLAVEIGERCGRFMQNTFCGLAVKDVQCDEIWGFVQCKEKTRERLDKSESFGDAYCFTAIERTSKLLVAWHCGKRSPDDTERFIHKLNAATSGNFQVSTDGYGPYRVAIPWILGKRVDFGRVIKNYTTLGDEQRRYSPATVSSCELIPNGATRTWTTSARPTSSGCNLSMRMGMAG